MKQVKPLVGAVGNPTVRQYADAIGSAGFEIEINENASIDGLQADLIEQADRFYTRLGRAIRLLVRCRVLPAHFETLFERLSRGGQAFVDADRLHLVTSSHYIVAQKKA